MEFKRGIGKTADMKNALQALERQVKSDDLRALDQLCVGKTADQLKAMAGVVRGWRLKLRGEEEALERLRHRPGDKVSFHDKHGTLITGIVKTANTRTLSLDQCSDGARWKVAYCFVTKIK